MIISNLFNETHPFLQNMKEAYSLYKMCFEYLKWTVSFNEFGCFCGTNIIDALPFSYVHPQNIWETGCNSG
jgi:hypothetical protein